MRTTVDNWLLSIGHPPLYGSADDALPTVEQAQPEAQTEQQGAESVGRTALPSDPKEKREALLDRFRTLGGKRPKEGGDKGTRGVLAKLQRETGIDDKNLGVMLDKAIDEKAAANMWRQLAAK